jgi:hypothetical protein
MLCDSGEALDPRYQCRCVSITVITNLYSHGLDEFCNNQCTGTGCGGNGSGSGSFGVGVDVDGTITIGTGSSENGNGGSSGGSSGSGSGSIGVGVGVDVEGTITVGTGGSNSGGSNWGTCSDGYYWDMEACACFAEIQCTLHCAMGYDLDPRQTCQCVH